MTTNQKAILKFLILAGLLIFFLRPLLNSPAFAVTNKAYLRAAYNSRENKYLLVWTDGRNSSEGVDCYDTAGCNPDIYAAFLDQNLALGTDFPLANSNNEQSYPEIAYNSRRNEYLVVFNQKDAETFNIYGLRINNLGQVLATIPITAEANDQDQWEPSVSYDSANDRYLVVWMGIDRGTEWGKDIRSQLLNGDGSKIGSIQYLSRDENATRAIDNQERPVAVFVPEEQKYLVVWENESRGGNGTVLDKNGNILISPKNFFFVQNSGRIVYPQIGYSRLNRRLTVTWQEGFNVEVVKVKAQQLTTNGQKIGPTVILDNNTSPASQYQNPRPGIACDPENGSCLVGWYNWRQYKSNLQFLDQNNQISGTEILGLGSRPTIIFNSAERYFLVIKSDNPTQFKTITALASSGPTPTTSSNPTPEPTERQSSPSSANNLNFKVEFSGAKEESAILINLGVKNKNLRQQVLKKKNNRQSIPLSNLSVNTEYEFTLSAFPFLSVKKTLTVREGENPAQNNALDFGTLKTGDLNSDNQINGLDWSLMKLNFGKEGDE